MKRFEAADGVGAGTTWSMLLITLVFVIPVGIVAAPEFIRAASRLPYTIELASVSDVVGAFRAVFS